MMMLANNYTMVQDVGWGTSYQDFVLQAYVHTDYIALTASHKRENNLSEAITQDMYKKNSKQNIIFLPLLSASWYKQNTLLRLDNIISA